MTDENYQSLGRNRRESDPGHPSTRTSFDRIDSSSDPGHGYSNLSDLGADESVKDFLASIRFQRNKAARSSYAETSSQSYISIETPTPHPSTGSVNRLEREVDQTESPSELSDSQPLPNPWSQPDSDPIVDSGEHTARQSPTPAAMPQRFSTVDYQQAASLPSPRPRNSLPPSQDEYVIRSSLPDIIQASNGIPGTYGRARNSLPPFQTNSIAQSIPEDTPLPPIPPKEPVDTSQNETPRTSIAPSRSNTSQYRTSAVQDPHRSIYSQRDSTAQPRTLSSQPETDIESQSNDQSLPLPATAKQSNKDPQPSRISAAPSSDKPNPNAPSQKDIDAGAAPKPRPPLESNPSQANTRYMNMLLALDDIPQLHNIMAGFFTWILLAGFVLFPGTFTSLQEANGEGLGSAGVAILGAVQHLPL